MGASRSERRKPEHEADVWSNTCTSCRFHARRGHGGRNSNLHSPSSVSPFYLQVPHTAYSQRAETYLHVTNASMGPLGSKRLILAPSPFQICKRDMHLLRTAGYTWQDYTCPARRCRVRRLSCISLWHCCSFWRRSPCASSCLSASRSSPKYLKHQNSHVFRDRSHSIARLSNNSKACSHIERACLGAELVPLANLLHHTLIVSFLQGHAVFDMMRLHGRWQPAQPCWLEFRCVPRP